jgi:hypothetical protein
VRSELTALGAATTRAVQRLILRAKGGDFAAAAPGARAKLAAPAAEPEGSAPAAWRASDAPVSVDAGAAEQTVRTTLPRFGVALAQAIHTSVPEAGATLGRSSTGEPGRPAIGEPGRPSAGEIEELLQSVARGDERARAATDLLVTLGQDFVDQVVARLPGPLRLDRHTLRGATPPLGDHGPILHLLSRFGQRAREPLLRRVADASLEVRYYVALALGELGGAAVIEALGTRIFDSDAGVRRVAIEALERTPDSLERRALVESLRAELPGPDALRQRLAAEALGGMRDAPSVPRLIELVKHPDAQLVTSARRALIAITKQDFGASRWRWRGWWDRHRDESRVEWMLEGLGHSEPEVRLSASEELKHLSNEYFGYQFDLPKREREDARRRWIAWWRTHGQNQSEKR